MASSGRARKAQSSIEFMVWISLAMLMAIASISAFGVGFSQIRPAAGNMELQAMLTTLFANADSIGEGGTRIARFTIPPGLGNSSVEEAGAGWHAMSFSYGNATYNRTFPYEVVFAPRNLLEIPGEHVVRMSRNGGVLIVEEIRHA